MAASLADESKVRKARRKVLKSIAILLITTPVILPAMQHLQINPTWYGILLVITSAVALQTSGRQTLLLLPSDGDVKARTKAVFGSR